MALHYLIDGYNMIYALPTMPSGTWEQKRAALLHVLISQKPQGNNRVTVVFDSREGSGDRAKVGEISVVYTSGETADDWIIKHVREVSNARIYVVVTDDQGIRLMIRGTGAKGCGVQEFLKAKTPQAAPAKENHPPKDSDSITDELKKKWL